MYTIGNILNRSDLPVENYNIIYLPFLNVNRIAFYHIHCTIII